ncbi:coiled-coil domain-containing 81 isoform X1 [Pelobates cultripes]|uniref:Coiled-coil domain-containing 81 isoform X1 n=1 Tax=Pelobates cultripes TaxID=61616 RepID=A0AAD1VPF4_PELCU|nr:coiled-coil domain-containing 81 isoform X1 [Pelobates cultripes]
MLDFLVDTAKSGFPTLSKLTEDDVSSIWASVSEFIENQMALQKGVQISGLGTLTQSRYKLEVGGNNKFIVVQRPVFLLSEKLAQTHNLKYNKLFVTGDIPVVPLNYIALSLESPFSRDTIEGCVKETISIFSRSIAIKQHVEFNFKGIGVLHIRDSKVKMKFFKDFINSLDGSGNLVKSLSNRPGTCDSVMSGRDSDLQCPRSSSALLFPRIVVKEVDNAPIMETIEEENVEADCTEGQTSNEYMDKESQAEEDLTRKREISTPKRLLNRPHIVPAKLTGISFSEELERIIKPKTAPERLGSSLSAKLSKTEVEACDTQTDKHQIRPMTSGCIDHCRAGQELCYLCMQRAQNNIPVYLTEERKLREQEEERILLQYQHMRDQEAHNRAQLASLMNKEQSQKDAAYNLGVADAIRNEKNQKNTEFYASYIFQKRPLTPPACLKREQCHHSLTKQMAEKREKEVRGKQDKELLGRLEQVQLAEELATQRAKYIKEKHEQTQCYKNALDNQVKIKPYFTLSPQPDTKEPVFGRNDMNNEKLVEKRKREEEVYRHQLQVAAEKKRLAILNDLVRQRNEVDMLRRSKQQVQDYRATEYEKISRLQKALQDDWAKSSEMKRQRDHNEQKFIQAGSQLLLDQFENYRRCFQCKRRTTNCGETNIWCESRYIPGSRLMV